MEQPVSALSPPASFGALLRARRYRACLSQEQLAARAGLSERTVRNLEAGRVQSPRAGTVRLLDGALQLSDPERERWLEAAWAGQRGTAVYAQAGGAGGGCGARGWRGAAGRGGAGAAAAARGTPPARRSRGDLAAGRGCRRRGGSPPVTGRGSRISQMPESESMMHTFADYAPRGGAQVAGLVRDNPVAAVNSTGHGVPVATPGPVIIPPSEPGRPPR